MIVLDFKKSAVSKQGQEELIGNINQIDQKSVRKEESWTAHKWKRRSRKQKQQGLSFVRRKCTSVANNDQSRNSVPFNTWTEIKNNWWKLVAWNISN